MAIRSIAHILKSTELNMGGTIIKQPLPTQRVERISPFLLLHHFGPFEVVPGSDPLDVGPHPHRGFEPVTFLYSGGLRHKDSRGNEGFLEGGDIQWMTAGMGIIHSEKASKSFLESGGKMEGIQLWVNLAKDKKMVQPRYQDIKNVDIPTYTEEGIRVKVVAGSFKELKGPALTYSPIQALQVSIEAGKELVIDVPSDYNALAYILKGQLLSNNGFEYQKETLLNFASDGNQVLIKANQDSEILFLAAEPIDEPVAQWGPYVMNTQSELLQAMRDYQMGKMGYYVD